MLDTSEFSTTLLTSLEKPIKGKVISTRLLAPSNADLPIFITLAGITILVRLLAPEKADCPIPVNCESSSNVTVVKLLVPEKALLSISIMVLGIDIP